MAAATMARVEDCRLLRYTLVGSDAANFTEE
jgi:hypothetical protein